MTEFTVYGYLGGKRNRILYLASVPAETAEEAEAIALKVYPDATITDVVDRAVDDPEYKEAAK